MLEELRWKKYPVLNDGFICLVDVMGDDQRIVNAARCSYGKDERYFEKPDFGTGIPRPQHIQLKHAKKDRDLIRRLMMDGHTSPFEKVKFEFFVRVPMDCWRQWIRHRTADVNEYSTRYSEAIDSQQTTLPGEWRLQAKDNKQGSSGFLEEWPEKWNTEIPCQKYPLQHPIDIESSNCKTPGQYLSAMEEKLIEHSRVVYQERLEAGIAREQARKDLPLSTYTEAYWGCSLHNIFNFLRLRMDSHAQHEIRLYANAMFEIIKQVCPLACEAFEDYVLNARRFSAMEMTCIRGIVNNHQDTYEGTQQDINIWSKPDKMTDNEWAAFKKKLSL